MNFTYRLPVRCPERPPHQAPTPRRVWTDAAWVLAASAGIVLVASPIAMRTYRTER